MATKAQRALYDTALAQRKQRKTCWRVGVGQWVATEAETMGLDGWLSG